MHTLPPAHKTSMRDPTIWEPRAKSHFRSPEQSYTVYLDNYRQPLAGSFLSSAIVEAAAEPAALPAESFGMKLFKTCT